MRTAFFRHISWYLVVAMFVIGVTPRLDAGMAPSELIASPAFDRAGDIEKVRKVIETKVVTDRLGKFGLTSEEVRDRIGRLSDSQLHQFAQQIDDLNIGQGDALGVVIALLIIAILVIVVLNLTGHKVIVTK